MKYDYLHAVEQRLKKENSKKTILAELEAHINDKLEYYLELGYSKEEAEKRAVEEMGEPDDAALPLGKLYNSAAQEWCALFGYVFLIISVILPFFFEKFDYAGGFYREVYHLISFDYISLAVVFGYAAVLIFANKSKDKVLTLSAAIALLVSNLSGMVVFRPAVYSFVKLAFSGINGYIDDVFAYSYFNVDYKFPLLIGSYIIFAVLLIWAFLQFTAIYRQERLLNAKKLNVIIRNIKRVTIVLLCVNAAIMSAATVAAVLRIPEKREQLHNERIKMIGDIITTPLDDLRDLHFYNEGYRLIGLMPPLNMYKEEFDGINYLCDQYVYCGLPSNNYYVTDKIVAFYARSNYDLPFDVYEKYEVDEEHLRNIKTANLREFIDEGRYDKAYQVLNKGNKISFSFYTTTHKTGTVIFEKTQAGQTDDLSKYIFRGTEFVNDIYGGI